MTMSGFRGRIALVTGASRGIGGATAAGLAEAGMSVFCLSRNSPRDASRSAGGNGRLEFLPCDLSSPASIRAAAAELRKRTDRLNLLINGAAVLTDKRTVTPEGLELMFATNHLGPFLLTHLLLDRLKAGAPSRIITLTAPSTVKPDLGDLQGQRRFSAARAFGASKAGNLLFTYALARRVKAQGITANACHPGVTRTSLTRHAPLVVQLLSRVIIDPFSRTPERAAEGVIALAVEDKFAAVTGELVHDGKIIKAPFQADTDLQERFWAESAALRLEGFRRAS